MNRKDAIKTLKAMRRRSTGDEAAALKIAIEHVVHADQAREAEIDKAVEIIRSAVFDSDGKLRKGAWQFLKVRIGFPEEDKAEIIKRLGLADKED